MPWSKNKILRTNLIQKPSPEKPETYREHISCSLKQKSVKFNYFLLGRKNIKHLVDSSRVDYKKLSKFLYLN